MCAAQKKILPFAQISAAEIVHNVYAFCKMFTAFAVIILLHRDMSTKGTMSAWYNNSFRTSMLSYIISKDIGR